jgi:hypothetical protein
MGDHGPQGQAGTQGAQGEAGLPGAPGQRGPAGIRGAAGPTGAPGVKGDSGEQGHPGENGTPGAPGPKGDKGEQGEQGEQGERGPRGTTGEGLDINWPAIEKINWENNASLDLQAAVLILHNMQITFSAPISPASQETRPQVIQVWYEQAVSENSDLMPIVTIAGISTVTEKHISWQPQNTPGALLKQLRNGGRIGIRIHCGVLLDTDNRPFSASLDVLNGVQSPRLPGGVFESWYFIRGNTDG